MKIFAYGVREDEVKYFEEFIKDGVECGYTAEYPTIDNLKLAEGYDAISIITNVFTEDMYDALAQYGVKYIATRSVGYDHMKLGYMKKLGMAGVHASYSPNAVANYTIMMMLMACRNIQYILDKSKLQDFTLDGKLGKELSLCTVGVIGCGQIGETVIRHLSGFGCRILVNSHREKEELKQLAEYVDLDRLYAESDIITLHVPGLDSNYHMIDKAALAKMKDDVILINTARGLLVDSYALIDAIESGKVGYAALDTFEEEVGLYYKNREGEALANRVRALLTSFPNVMLTPHMAFYTEQSTADMVRTTMKGLLAFETQKECPWWIEG